MDRSVALAKRSQLWRREKSLVPAKEDYFSKTFFAFSVLWKIWTQELFQKVEFDRPGERSPE